jgi:hypothetical protein
MRASVRTTSSPSDDLSVWFHRVIAAFSRGLSAPLAATWRIPVYDEAMIAAESELNRRTDGAVSAFPSSTRSDRD